MCEGVGALCLAGGRHTWMDDQINQSSSPIDTHRRGPTWGHEGNQGAEEESGAALDDDMIGRLGGDESKGACMPPVRLGGGGLSIAEWAHRNEGRSVRRAVSPTPIIAIARCSAGASERTAMG